LEEHCYPLSLKLQFQSTVRRLLSGAIDLFFQWTGPVCTSHRLQGQPKVDVGPAEAPVTAARLLPETQIKEKDILLLEEWVEDIII
jgi:hypothetical protein